MLKALIKPIYNWLRKVGLIKTRSDNHLQKLISSYDMFNEMSKLSNINKIMFDNAVCVIELSDKRKYVFNPLVRASRLYSVPMVGDFERKETQFLSTIINKGDVCADVGACFGWYTVMLSNLVGDVGKVIAFEPLPENHTVLNNNISLNKLTNVHVMSIALGEEKANSKLFLSDIGVSGSLKLHDYQNTFDEIKCEIDTFDSVFEGMRCDRLDFIKADIEGGELSFLHGAYNCIKKYKPTIMLEIQENSTKLFDYLPADVFNFMEKLGYKPFCIVVGESGETTLCPVDKLAEVLPDYNFLFMHGERSR